MTKYEIEESDLEVLLSGYAVGSDTLTRSKWATPLADVIARVQAIMHPNCDYEFVVQSLRSLEERRFACTLGVGHVGDHLLPSNLWRKRPR